ncbi:MAG: MFS transporter [Spirochaetaceae bacterium]|nr:MFS transporter [Spirochaetaceae bacterium]
MRGASGWTSRFSAMRHRDFRYLWLGNSIVMGGNQATFIAASYLAYELTDSAFILGLVSMGFALPMLTLSLLGGALSDRMPRKRILQIGQLLIAASAASVAVAIKLDVVAWGHLLAASAVQGVAFAFVVPARQSLIADIVGEDLAGNAVALVSVSFSITGLLGPAVAGVLYDAIGPFGVYVVVLASDLLAVLCTSLVRHSASPRVPSTGKRSFLRDIGAGLRYVRNDGLLVALIVVALAFTVLAMPYRFLLPVLVVDVYQQGPRTLGLLSSMIGLGAIVGASYVAWSGRRWRGALLIGGAVASGLGLALVGTVPVLAVAVGLTVIVGIGDALRRALNQALLLETANAEYRGRVVSIYAMNFGLTPAGALPAGALAELLGVRMALVIFGVLLILLAAWIAVRSPRLIRYQ